MFHQEPGREPESRAGPRILALGSLVVLADLTLGVLLNVNETLPPLDRGDLQSSVEPTADSFARRDEPWAAEFDRELTEFQSEVQYSPFVVQAFYPYDGEYVTTSSTERRSYRQRLQDENPLQIAFLGGSTMFGIGQRDDHTIPSEFARIAEKEGLAVEVHNYGFPRWVLWQEYQYLERVLAAGTDIDLVVFYDGFNEFLMQELEHSPDPTHHARSAMIEVLDKAADERQDSPGVFDQALELGSSYRRASGAMRILDRLLGRRVPLPGESIAADEAATAEERAEDALDVYRRGQRAVEALSEDHDVQVRFFWQPSSDGWDPAVLANLPRSTADLSDVHSGLEDELYFDPIHTNERGARLVAEAMWDVVRADLVVEQP